MPPVLLASLTLVARAAGPVERPLLPSYSVAGDDGAAAMWSNPANLALDPDRSWYVGFGQALVPDAPATAALASHAGPLATGLVYRHDPSQAPSWLTFSNALALRLDDHLAAGVHMGWQVPQGADNNFVTWDVATSWRPLPWLGFGFVAYNLGGTGAGLGVEERWATGVALRPLGDRVQLGVDWVRTGATDAPSSERVVGRLLLRPARGITFRAELDSDLAFAAGFEMHFSEGGLGAHGRGGAGGSSALLYGMSTAPEHRLAALGRTVAEFDLRGDFEYQPSGGLFAEPGESYLHLLGRLRRAARDPAVEGILVRVHAGAFSLAQVEELREVLQQARERGKPVVAYLDEDTGNRAYLLATAADRIYLHPAAALEITGLHAELRFYRETLDLVGIDAQFARRSEYKTGPEPYTRSESSEPAREELTALLDSLFRRWVGEVACARRLSPEEVEAAVDAAPLVAEEARRRGLVDGIAYLDELDEELGGTLFSEDYDVDDEYGLEGTTLGWPARHEIAVVYVEGPIVTGESRAPGLLSGRVTGSRTVVEQLDAAREDDAVDAVVLRVDSPGGSAFASEEIWRAVRRLEEADKPVVVSMGGVAASGGYYVSSGARAILAEPTTITGSIGVYAGKLSFGRLYERVGVHTEEYDRGRVAGMWSTARPMDEVELARMESLVDDTYERFKARVAEGRGLDPERVEEVARGRVWTGGDALERHLVDELGGFWAAVERARVEAGLPEGAEVRLVRYGERRGEGGELPKRAVTRLRALLGPSARPATALPPGLDVLAERAAMADERVLALMPWRIEVE